MVMYGYQWLFMVINGYQWLCMVIIGYIWLCMVIIGYHWLSMVMYGYQWLCIIMNGYVLVKALLRVDYGNYCTSVQSRGRCSTRRSRVLHLPRDCPRVQ